MSDHQTYQTSVRYKRDFAADVGPGNAKGNLMRCDLEGSAAGTLACQF